MLLFQACFTVSRGAPRLVTGRPRLVACAPRCLKTCLRRFLVLPALLMALPGSLSVLPVTKIHFADADPIDYSNSKIQCCKFIYIDHKFGVMIVCILTLQSETVSIILSTASLELNTVIIGIEWFETHESNICTGSYWLMFHLNWDIWTYLSKYIFQFITFASIYTAWKSPLVPLYQINIHLFDTYFAIHIQMYLHSPLKWIYMCVTLSI